MWLRNCSCLGSKCQEFTEKLQWANQLVLSKKPNCWTIETDLPLELENKTSSELVQENLNSLHSAQGNFIKAESSEELKKIIKHNIRTHADVVYKQGDIVFYKRANNTWKGPGTVIGTDGQKKILIKHGSFYVRVHSCNVQSKDTFSNNKSAQYVKLDPVSETLPPSISLENFGDMNYDNPLLSSVNEGQNFNPTGNANSVEIQAKIRDIICKTMT